MSRYLLASVALVLVCTSHGSAGDLIFDEADLPEDVVITRTPLTDPTAHSDADRALQSPVYSNLGFGQNQAEISGGGLDGYTTTLSGGSFDTFILAEFAFIGGVEQLNTIIFFDFFFNDFSFAGSFGIQPGSTGVFLYEFSVGIPVPTSGFLNVSGSGGTVIWLATDAAPTVGSSTPGSAGGGLDFKFALGEIPAPPTVALIALAGLAASRRRRRRANRD